MAFLKRQKAKDIRLPTGVDAVHLRKLLFLSIPETLNLLHTDGWNRLDLRCLTLMKTKMLRAACIARNLEPRGRKRVLVQRLTESLEKQRDDEAEMRRQAELAEERRLNKLGGIWTFGTGTQGQLGHNDCQSYALPTQIKSTRGLGVCQVYAGFDSDVTFAVTRLGDIYVWGIRSGPTGLPRVSKRRTKAAASPLDSGLEAVGEDPGDETSDEDNDDENEDEDDDEDDKEDNVEPGDDDSDDENDETTQGTNEILLAPVKLQSLCGEDIVQIAVGRVHCAARSKCGDVFTWGHNDHCQLGHEPIHSLSEALSKVEISVVVTDVVLSMQRAKIKHGMDAIEPTIWVRTVPENCVIKQVAVGTDHTLTISDAGEILAFGSVYNTSDHSTLSRHLKKQRVFQVSCGAMHAAILNEQGQMYTWGSGDGGRLGHGDLASHVTPRLVEALADDVVFQISCGCWHTLAIVLVPPLLKGGFVYSWGTGRYGQLALGGNQVVPTPTLIKDFLVQTVYIKRVCAGMYHNVALSVDDEVYTWGSNVNGCLGRPDEMATNPESFSAVPGMVEGMSEFVGRPCAIAVGREYTVVATKPYIGPNEEEVAQAREEATKRQEALDRQNALEEQKEQEEELALERQRRSQYIDFLNRNHPLCTQCKIASVCPGFQRDDADPALCRHCLHLKPQHNDQRRESNKALTLDYLEGVLEVLQVDMDVIDT
ncbi:unnamed protein product [Aphanomyces euteiches]|nr:hypothetical protein AeRB84_016392 [Aphanomyces euteiches]